jgi:hypothetical protein
VKTTPAEIHALATSRRFVALVRALAMLVLLAVVLGTTVATAFVAGMDAGANHALHAGVTTRAEVDGAHGCAGRNACGETDAGRCASACVGLKAFALLHDPEEARSPEPSTHAFPSETRIEGRSPDPNERPPRPGLL